MKKPKFIQTGAAFLMCLANGMVTGSMVPRDSPFADRMIALGIFLLALGLQLVIHEAGHWFFGRLEGYELSSYRIGSRVWIRQNGKLVCRRYSVPGTLGQCLMVPAKGEDPSGILYNLGGVFANLAASLLFFGLAFFVEGWVRLFALEMGVSGLFFAAANGLPMDNGLVKNDGANVRELKDPILHRLFHQQLRMHQALVQGTRLKDMPEDWFVGYTEEGREDAALSLVLLENRAMDQMDFKTARLLANQALEKQDSLTGVHVQLLLLDLYYLDKLEGKQKPPSKALKKFLKTGKHLLPVLRTQADDPKMLKALLNKETSYPYWGDWKSEWELACRLHEARSQTASI